MLPQKFWSIIAPSFKKKKEIPFWKLFTNSQSNCNIFFFHCCCQESISSVFSWLYPMFCWKFRYQKIIPWWGALQAKESDLWFADKLCWNSSPRITTLTILENSRLKLERSLNDLQLLLVLLICKYLNCVNDRHLRDDISCVCVCLWDELWSILFDPLSSSR